MELTIIDDTVSFLIVENAFSKQYKAFRLWKIPQFKCVLSIS